MANWYGIPGIEFIFRGQSDALVKYNGKIANSIIVEDTMWENFSENFTGDPVTKMHEFEDYMNLNSELVKELIELACTSDDDNN